MHQDDGKLESSQKKKWLVALVSVGAGILLVYFSIFGFRTASASSVQKELNGSLAPGMPAAEVAQILGDRGIDAGSLTRVPITNIHGHRYENQLLLIGRSTHTARALLWSESILVIAVFDENRKLTRFEVIPVYDSL